MSALPYIFLWAFEISAALFADKILKNKFNLYAHDYNLTVKYFGYF